MGKKTSSTIRSDRSSIVCFFLSRSEKVVFKTVIDCQMYWTGEARKGIAGYFLKKSCHMLGSPPPHTTWDDWNKKSGEHCSTRLDPLSPPSFHFAVFEVIMSFFYHSFGVEGKIVVENRQTNEMQPSSRMV